MRSNYFFTILVAIVATLFTGTSIAFTVEGPYNNRTTAVKFSYGGPNIMWLYAINAIDRPTIVQGTTTYQVYNRWTIPTTITNDPYFEPYRFRDNSNNPITFPYFPTMFARTSIAPSGGATFCLVAFDPTSTIIQRTYRTQFGTQNGLVWGPAPQSFPTNTRISRVWPNSGNGIFQLAGENQVGNSTTNPIIYKTTNAWNSVHILNSNTELPAGNAVYSIGAVKLESMPLPADSLRIVVALSSDLALQNTADPHSGQYLINNLYYYWNNHSNPIWSQLPIPGGLPDNLYNVQVSLIRGYNFNTPSHYFLYIVGLVVNGNSVEPFCRRAIWYDNGTFGNWSSFSQGYGPTVNGKPNFPYDIVTARNGGDNLIQVELATEYKLYHKSESINPIESEVLPWSPDMNGVTTTGFRKLSVTPDGSKLAVAGLSNSYFCGNWGSGWIPIRSSGSLFIPPSGVVQGAGATDPMLALYANSAPPNALTPVCVQIAPHQSNATNGSFNQTIELSKTFEGLEQYSKIAVTQTTNGSQYICAFPDANVMNHTTTDPTTGLVYLSENGLNWTPATWGSHDFTITPESIPRPYQLHINPHEPNVVLMSFNHLIDGSPIAFSYDFGVSWQIPSSNFTGDTDFPNLITSAVSENTYRTWCLNNNPYGTHLYLSDNFGTLWTLADGNAPWHSYQPNFCPSITASGNNLTRMFVASNHTENGTNGGWIYVNQFEDNVWTSESWLDQNDHIPTISQILADPNLDNVLLAASSQGNYGWLQLIVRRNNRTWGRTLGHFNPRMVNLNGFLKSKISLEVVNETPTVHSRRVTWSATEWDQIGLPTVQVINFDVGLLPPPPPPPAYANIDMVSPGSPIVIPVITVIESNVTLTVHEGVQLQIAPVCSLIVKGKLIVDGKGTDPVSLVAASDSLQTWSGIYVQAGGKLIMINVKIENAKQAIHIADGADTVIIRNCIFNGDSVAITISGIQTYVDFQNCTFSGSSTAIKVNSGVEGNVTIQNNTFEQEGGTVLYVSQSSINFSNNTIDYDGIDDNSKAVMIIACETAVPIDSCTLEGNGKGSGI